MMTKVQAPAETAVPTQVQEVTLALAQKTVEIKKGSHRLLREKEVLAIHQNRMRRTRRN